jgi:hypothetical protein
MPHPKSSVKIVEVCWVAPQPGSPHSAYTPDQSLPLTYFDLLWVRFPPVERLYFYELTSSNSFDFVLLKISKLPSLSFSNTSYLSPET